ncbi:LLM class flavin-dependent oxidoreductase [Acidisoma silvae]|uniref:LLM class flavin-dependent oxidoreductase n=1 Tax=Acidisoma silvae TaxID=2802396 RepID=A0A963YY83_9PROT|nr:LLM class flavin-dependent oxidoreductase [Acidisoma silvae]MCB8878502.1 LLM class flavin-dependent oxidoreductase [Acidisoma silvae]
MSKHPVRFGVWANVHGTLASLSHPDDPVDASWPRVRDQVLLAEKLGFDTTLVAQHTMNPVGEELDQLDAWTAAAALAALTKKIEIIGAIKPSVIHPTILAKQAVGIEEISEGRFSVNVVNAWWKPDLERSGIGMLPHDERYAFGKEWLHVVAKLMSGERVTYHGRYLKLDDFGLRPAPTRRSRPTIYIGGESEPARELAAAEADVLFLNGQAPESAAAFIADVRVRPRGTRPPLRFGMSAFIVAAKTDPEAEELLEYHWQRNSADKAAQGALMERLVRQVDEESAMWKALKHRPHIGPNGGTAAGLVGSFDTVAERIVTWNRLGIETFMLGFQPLESDMTLFAAEVMPRVKRLESLAG